MTERLRAPFLYYGGKGNMLAKLLPWIPTGGRPYCEPFAGAASILFARDPAPVEVLNDIDKDIVNFFRCLQNKESFEELRHRLMFTPYAKDEFARAIEILKSDDNDKVMRAWGFFVTQNQIFNGIRPYTIGSWGRAITSSTNGISGNVNKWLMRLSMLDAFRWRLMMVQIDNNDAIEAIRYWDNEEAVFYLDPPYVSDTRKSKKKYNHEMNDDQHKALVEACLNIKGSAVLSCYDHPIYHQLEEAGWRKISWNTACHAPVRTRKSGLQGAGKVLAKVPRTETAYINSKSLEVLKCQTFSANPNGVRPGYGLESSRLTLPF